MCRAEKSVIYCPGSFSDIKILVFPLASGREAYEFKPLPGKVGLEVIAQ